MAERERTAGDVCSTEDLGSALAAVADVVVTIDSDDSIETVVDVGTATLGYDPEALAGNAVTALFADGEPVDGVDVHTPAAFQSALRGERADGVVAPLLAADGSVVPMALSTAPRTGPPGRICVARETDTGTDVSGDQRDLVDSIADPLYVLDTDGCLRAVNDAMVAYTGYAREDLLGREISELLPAGEGFEQVAGDDERTRRFETTFITADGERILTEVHASVRTAPDGTDAGSVGVLRDIRERKQREESLDLLKQVLARVFRHNVRNELSVITSRAELLAAETDGQSRSHADAILSAADRLTSHSEKARLIQQVIESDRQREVALAATVTDVLDTARQQYPSARIDFDEAEEMTVEAHPRIDRAIAELVENAVEHAPDDERARVRVWLDRRDGARTVYVEDDSGGLSEQERRVLSEGEESDLEHSSGVGLWLVRWLVEASDAEMVVHRTEAGSLMGIRFPAQTDPTAASMESPLTRTPAHVQETSPARFRGDTVIERLEPRQQLEETYEALERTGGRTVLLTGEAGIGKTTLVDQFCAWLQSHEQSPVLARGSCEEGVQPPYHGFRQVVSELPAGGELPQLLADARSLSATDADEVEQRRRAVFADIATQLRTVATDRPVVLVVEDMQWADRGTVDMFEYLVDEVGRWGHPVLFLGTYRTSDVEQTHPVLEIAEATATAGRGTVLELEPFGESEVQALLSQLLGVGHVPPSLVEAVHEHTGGTPLFVAELGRHLLDVAGDVETVEELPASLDTVAVPETVGRAVAERLETLPGTVRPVLDCGAVIGREVSFDVLQAASERPVDELVAGIDTLVRRQVWSRSGDTIEFVHGVIREQTLESIAVAERERLHERVAAAIETVHAGALGAHAGRLAAHYEAIGEYDTAFDYYRQAGEHAVETYANEDAIDHYERALTRARSHDVTNDSTVATVSAALGNVLELTGAHDRAHEQYRESLDIARKTGDREREAASLNRLANLARKRGEYEQAETDASQALALARDHGDGRREVNALFTLGDIARGRGSYDRAREFYEQCLPLYRDLGDRQGEARTLYGLGQTAFRQGTHDEARQYYRESLDIAREAGDREREAASLHGLGNLAFRHEAYDRARENYQESLDIARDIGARLGKALCRQGLGNIASRRGKYERSLDHYERCLDIYRELGDRQGEAQLLHNLGAVSSNLGEYERATEYYERSLDIKREIGDRRGEANTLHSLGQITTRRGEYGRAREYNERSLDIRRDIGYRNGEARSLVGLGRVALRTNECDHARECLVAAVDLAEEAGLPEPAGIAFREWGRLARRQGDHEAAAALLGRSLDACSETENPLQHGKTQLERARLALARADYRAARDALAAASETFTELESTHEAARADLLRGRLAAATSSGDAQDCLQDALDTFETVGAVQDQLTALRVLVERCRQQGHEERAQRYRERAEQVFERAPGPVRARHADWLGPSSES